VRNHACTAIRWATITETVERKRKERIGERVKGKIREKKIRLRGGIEKKGDQYLIVTIGVIVDKLNKGGFKEKKSKKEQRGTEYLIATLGERAGKILYRRVKTEKRDDRDGEKWCFNCDKTGHFARD
jgi:hypothetical protein